VGAFGSTLGRVGRCSSCQWVQVTHRKQCQRYSDYCKEQSKADKSFYSSCHVFFQRQT